ncbi:MAG: hypothetical protein U0931_28415 [Vulcanimicrobiota bacterium]
MADLLGQLQQSTDQVARLGEQVVLAGQRIQETQSQCERAIKECQSQYQPLQADLQGFRDHLEARWQSIDQGSQELIGQCREVSSWSETRAQQAGAIYAESRTQLAQASAQMTQSQGQLEQQRLLLTGGMMLEVELLNRECSSLVSELQATQKFIGEQMLPGLQQRQAKLAQQGQDIREQIMNRLLPELTLEFDRTRQHLDGLVESLRRAGQGNAEASRQATLASLESLGKALEALCTRSAEATRNSLDQLTANTTPVRNRVDEFNKQTKVFQEIGTPASGHLKMLVNVVSQLEDLLIQAKVLSPS